MIELENHFIKIKIDAAAGGKIISVYAENDEWLFYDPSRQKSAQGEHLAYDDVWTGGFEELFPNDAPCELNGVSLPDHGEFWSAAMQIENTSPQHVILTKKCTTYPVLFEKKIQLTQNGFTIFYQFNNQSNQTIDYLFKLHPSMRLETDDQLIMPKSRFKMVDPSFSNVLGQNEIFAWPLGKNKNNETVDVSKILSIQSKMQEFIYCFDLEEGYCGYKRKRTGKTFLIEFPIEHFRFCWFFMSFGGWRDYYTVVLEPCTNMPKDLTEAKMLGQCAKLLPNETKEFQVHFKIV